MSGPDPDANAVVSNVPSIYSPNGKNRICTCLSGFSLFHWSTHLASPWLAESLAEPNFQN